MRRRTQRHISQTPANRESFFRIENLRCRAFNRLHIARRRRGHAAEALDEIERHPFSRQNGASRPSYGQQRRAGLNGLAVRHVMGELHFPAQLAKSHGGEFNPCQTQLLARPHRDLAHGIRGHRGLRGDITSPDVLGKCRAHGSSNQFWVQIRQHGASMVMEAPP